MQDLLSVSTDFVGWAAVLTGLAALAGVIGLVERRGRAPRGSTLAKAPARLEPAREWDLVLSRAAVDMARVPQLAALQADAAVKIEAAEHALGRLVDDWQKLRKQPAAPAHEASPQPAPGAPVRQPLAA